MPFVASYLQTRQECSPPVGATGSPTEEGTGRFPGNQLVPYTFFLFLTLTKSDNIIFSAFSSIVGRQDFMFVPYF